MIGQLGKLREILYVKSHNVRTVCKNISRVVVGIQIRSVQKLVILADQLSLFVVLIAIVQYRLVTSAIIRAGTIVCAYVSALI